MRTEVEPLEGNRVKLTVEVDPDEFEKAVEAAFRRISREVRVPGFRPGKVPRRVLEARIGKDAARQEALREALPAYYAQAVRDEDVDAIAPPEIDITSDGQEGPLAFDAVVEVRPTVSIPGYAGLQVTVPRLEVTDEDLDAQVDRLRETFAELKETSRPVQSSDHVTIDLVGSRNGEKVDDLSTEDFLYEVGSGNLLPELDDQLRGSKAGDILTFDAKWADQEPANFRVLVKEVKEKVLPDVDDEWASEASEFSTVAELKEDLRKRLEVVRRVQGRMALREGSLGALVELVSEEPPEALVNGEMERRLHDLGHRLEAQGANLAQYLEAIGQPQDEFVAALRADAAQSVKADLALRALADAEEMTADDADVEAEVTALASRYNVTPAELARQLAAADQMEVLRTDVRKNKALSWLMESIEVVDEEGRPVDRALLTELPEGLAAGVSEADDQDKTDTGQAPADEATAEQDKTDAGPAPADEATAEVSS